MENTFDTWDNVLTFCRIKEGALLCMVYDWEERQEVEKVVVGKAEMELSTMEFLESLTRGLFELAVKKKYFRNLNPENAGHEAPKFVCLLNHMGMKGQAVRPMVVGFASKEAALAFARTVKRAAEAQRRMALEVPPK